MDNSDVQIEDHMHKCRCCFRMLIDRAVKITGSIESKFYELTQIELIKSDSYSDVICELCDRDLRNFHHLKKDLTMKQLRYYELLPMLAPTCKEEIQINEEVTVEALDDVVLIYPSKLCSAPEAPDEEKIEMNTRKTPRKQRLERAPVGKKTFNCNECDMVLANPLTLRRHVERIHLKVRNFICDQCSFSAYFKKSLEAHVVKHIREEFRQRFVCDQCSFVSISAVNISLHKKYEHTGLKKVFTCSVNDCGKQFSRPGQLTAHVQLTHEKRKDKICSLCQRAFSTTTRLKDHIMTVHSSNTRDFTCEICSKQFVTIQQLKNHQVYHDEPKFPCEMGCDKKFYKQVLQSGHHKTHLKQKDYACTYTNCNQQYFLKSHLARHINSVHEKIKISCELCSTKFVRKENYRAHVINHHPELNESNLQQLLKKIKQLKPSIASKF